VSTNRTTDTGGVAGTIDQHPMLPTHTAAVGIALLASNLRALGVPISDTLQAWVTSAAIVLVIPAAAWLAHQRTTPLANPRDNLGRQLVPAPAAPPRSSVTRLRIADSTGPPPPAAPPLPAPEPHVAPPAGPASDQGGTNT
jgi:hypothetical protein